MQNGNAPVIGEPALVLCGESVKGIPHFKKGRVFRTPYALSRVVRSIRNRSRLTILAHIPGFLQLVEQSGHIFGVPLKAIVIPLKN